MSKISKKQVKVCRASGMPVIADHIESYRHEYQTLYDKVVQKLGMDTSKLITAELEQRCNKLLSRIERILLTKYPNHALWPEIKSQKAWRDAVDTYGPIAVARQQGSKELAYIILDVPFT